MRATWMLVAAVSCLVACGGVQSNDEESAREATIQVGTSTNALTSCVSQGCPAGYHITQYQPDLSCGSGGDCWLGINCAANTTSFWMCGSCPTGYRTVSTACMTQCIMCGAQCSINASNCQKI